MTVALIVAAGRGHRVGGPVPKQYRLLNDIPVIRHTIAAFCRHEAIAAVQVVIHRSDHTLYAAATEGLGLLPPLIGGDTRQDSVRLGLEGVAGLAPDTIVIHDAVRPFVAQATISAVIAALDHSAGAITGVKLTDTLKRCDQGRVVETLARDNLWRAQTPQGFRYAAIFAAHHGAHLAPGQDLTDDCMVAELAGLPIVMVQGSEANFKITTEDDLRRAELILRHGGWDG